MENTLGEEGGGIFVMLRYAAYPRLLSAMRFRSSGDTATSTTSGG